jgi:predicted DNA-binding transcriptional regulator AlpA
MKDKEIKNPTVREQYLTVPEMAAMCGMSIKTAWRRVHTRAVRSVVNGRLRRVPLSAIQEMMERGTVEAVN